MSLKKFGVSGRKRLEFFMPSLKLKDTDQTRGGIKREIKEVECDLIYQRCKCFISILGTYKSKDLCEQNLITIEVYIERQRIILERN